MTRDAAWIESSLAPPGETPHAWVLHSYRYEVHELLVARPRHPDQLLDDPTVLEASRSHDYMPYWAYLWPGAILLADHIMSQDWPAGSRALEIGCGLGLAGLAGLAKGMHMTFSDYSPAALALAEHNARLNGFTRFTTRLIDWQAPSLDHFALILGADVLYEVRCLDDVLRVLDAMLLPAGEALLSDPGRSVADDFPRRARERSFVVEQLPAEPALDSKQAMKGRIFRVNRVA
jgi:predicted nicotinamide N-methyase